MLLHPRHFVSFIDGRYGTSVTLAYVPGEFTRRIGSLSSDLLCGRDYAIKINRKHGLPYEKFQLIQSAIDRGYAKVVGFDLEFLFFDEEDPGGRPYLLAVKPVGRHEIWLKTFYRPEPWKEKVFFKRGTLIRQHLDYRTGPGNR